MPLGTGLMASIPLFVSSLPRLRPLLTELLQYLGLPAADFGDAVVYGAGGGLYGPCWLGCD